MTPKQQERLGKLLSMGIPLPLAFPLAMDPRGSAIAAQEVNRDVNLVLDKVGAPDLPKVVKRKASAYSKRYSKEFKKIAPKYKNKNGTWKKGGFKKAVKEAHKAVKK